MPRFNSHPFDEVTEEELRRRRSLKWRFYPTDVLPAWVAEMDYPLDETIQRTLQRAISESDCGYGDPNGLGDAFAEWAKARWGWDVRAADVHVVPQIVTGIAEILRVTTKPSQDVVIDTPAYPPFAQTVRSLGRAVLEIPLATHEGGYTLDLDAIERAYASMARVHLLCSPHNPTGIVHSPDTLARLAELADHYNVIVLSDEIHAPLCLPGTIHCPFPRASPTAARRGIVLTAASKGWNVAGLKAALMVASSDETRTILERLPPEIPFHVGHFGVLAGCAAFHDGMSWLSTVTAILDRNRQLLDELLREYLPTARYIPPQAGYLAWLDCRALGLGEDPARAFLQHGRVALSSGPPFGAPGVGFARLNIATTRTLLEEAVRRMASAVHGAEL